jgi:YHS domain-containing protein
MHKDKTEKVLEHIDPVCGMKVTPDSAAAKDRFEGETFYFCSDDCKRKFEMQPDEYAKSIVPK